MASQPIIDPADQPAPAPAAHFLLQHGYLTIRFEGTGAPAAPIATDAATLERFGHACLAMAHAAQQLAAGPHLSAGREIPLFTRARLTAEVAR